MRIIDTVLRELDRRRFLGFPIWGFSFHSFSRPYGRFFLREIVLRHPWRTLKGLWTYRRAMRGVGPLTRLFHDDDASFVRRAACQENGLLVALGFCQKPLDNGSTLRGCPVGRFNHECAILGRSDPFVKKERLPFPCRTCDVRALGLRALRAGAAFYIMTSAADIGRDVLLPIIDHGRFRQGIFLLCPYSVPAFILPLCIGRTEALFAAYESGDCRGYGQFIRADEGQKNEHTRLSPGAREKVMALLDRIAAERDCLSARHFQREGALFVPAADRNG